MLNLVVGVGEVGKPLLELIEESGLEVKGIDIEPVDVEEQIDIMHIAIPFKEEDEFVGTVKKYIEKYKPELTIINSTVVPGTTRKIVDESGKAVVHSPVRGVHARMKEELKFYTKYIGSDNLEWAKKAAEHYEKIGVKTRILDKPEKTEFIKLLSTSYYGLLIGWAQEVNRICKENELDYDEIMSYAKEIQERGHPRPVMRPEPIGGHCVIPNINLLKKIVKSSYLDAILESDEEIRKSE